MFHINCVFTCVGVTAPELSDCGSCGAKAPCAPSPTGAAITIFRSQVRYLHTVPSTQSPVCTSTSPVPSLKGFQRLLSVITQKYRRCGTMHPACVVLAHDAINIGLHCSQQQSCHNSAQQKTVRHSRSDTRSLCVPG